MSRIIVLSKGIFAVAATLSAATMVFMHSGGNGENSATIYQSGPPGSDATVEVKQRHGFTIIERRGAGGNTTTIIQQR